MSAPRKTGAQRRCQTMQRRKFLATVGSLTAGTAAAMGTGAFTQAEAERAVDVAVVNDANAYLAFDLSASSLENTEYASYENGQIQFHFDGNVQGPVETWETDEEGNPITEEGSPSGQGLNPNAVYAFDNVFQIQNQSGDQVSISIDKTGLQHSDDITIYGADMNGNVYEYNSGGPLRTRDWSGAINPGFGVNLGFRIETDDWTNENWETGSIVITAVDESDTSA